MTKAFQSGRLLRTFVKKCFSASISQAEGADRVARGREAAGDVGAKSAAAVEAFRLRTRVIPLVGVAQESVPDDGFQLLGGFVELSQIPSHCLAMIGVEMCLYTIARDIDHWLAETFREPSFLGGTCILV
ncbi:hypothetical protein [Bradyrhizobium liaoningense]|uniref:hypothetical protein n=1 Tax=Bradyrhizobium liaoningense TaxID=43992 RepID=UPI001BA4B130|nr:hypothetical protein [Bradyrhizobium liaoningense]MBR0948061.1 hypothetical protein [Bradyrhizobium liaoningense]